VNEDHANKRRARGRSSHKRSMGTYFITRSPSCSLGSIEALMADYPPKGVVYSLCAKRGILGGQPVCCACWLPLSQDQGRVQYAQGQIKGIGRCRDSPVSRCVELVVLILDSLP